MIWFNYFQIYKYNHCQTKPIALNQVYGLHKMFSLVIIVKLKIFLNVIKILDVNC